MEKSNTAQAERTERLMKQLIGMTSITYAVKAQKLLGKKGIRVRIVPTPKNVGSGCGYSLETDGNADRITRILAENGIKFKSVYT